MARSPADNVVAILTLLIGGLCLLGGAPLWIYCALHPEGRNTSGGDAFALIYFCSLLACAFGGPALLGTLCTFGPRVLCWIGIFVLLSYPFIIAGALYASKVEQFLTFFSFPSPLLLLTTAVAISSIRRLTSKQTA